ncbi:MAG: type IV toxin-antitoxin system AbiEi family antitoxin domain-containing protein [Solirubrobacteraceae bacterium]
MSEEISKDLQIGTIAKRQQGNITYGQLKRLGLSDAAILYRVKVGRLFRVHTGVYSVGRPPVTPLEKASAAVLACGPGAGLSHLGSLCLWSLLGTWPRPPFDVMTPTDRRPTGIRTHQARGLTKRDFTTHFGIRTTTAARAVLDAASRLEEKRLRRVLNDGLRTPYLRRSALDDVLARFTLHPGRKLIEPILDDVDHGFTDSSFEDELRAFCKSSNLPIPEFGKYIAGHRCDAVFEDAKLIIECDGWMFHNSRDSFESDRDRDVDTLEAGYATIRLTKRRLRDHPDREQTRLRNILATRTKG